MLRRAKRCCAFRGCKNLCRAAYCEEHKSKDPAIEAKAEGDRRRGSSAARGYDNRWRKFRNEYIKHHPVCRAEGCNRAAEQIDHIVPLSEGGDKYSDDNLQPLCATHHSIKTNKEDGGFGRRRKAR